MASTKVEWSKATGDAWGQGQVRTSKCGRYRIAKQMVSHLSMRNGCYRAEYTLFLLNPDGSTRHKFDGLEQLSHAREWAQEYADEASAKVTP